MKNVYEILQELKFNNSGNFKKEVLNKYKDNDELRRFFVLTLDKSINYYIRKIPKYSVNHTGETSLNEAMSSLSKLSKRILTGNRAKFFLSKLLTSCTSYDAEVICRIIKRDAKCRVSVGTVNKIWTELIKVWPVELCERSTRKNLDNIKYPAFIQEKSDGLRFNIVYINGIVKYRSRNGKYIELHGALDEEIKFMAQHVPYENFVIDGEGLIGKFEHINTISTFWTSYSEGDIFEDRTTGNGIFNKAIQNTISKQEASRVRVKVWDIIPYEEFMNKKGTVPYKKRIVILKNILKQFPDDITKIGLTLTKIVKSEKEALAFYKQMLQLGKEGAILKNVDGLWEDKRSKDQVKMKIKKELDMIVIDYYAHKKKKSWIGGLVVESSDGKVRVNVGSGLKDKHRKLEPHKFLKQIVMIEANGLIKSKNSKDDIWSLFLPIFKEIRIDKDVADSYEKIVDEFNSI